MKIMIASLMEVAKNIDFIKRNEINVISIRDTDHSHYYDIIDNAGLKNLLVVQFDDIVDYLPGRNETPPSEENIRTILEWAKQKMAENNNGFIVHCTAGISRSSAVAILVNYLHDPENALKIINPILHSPNEKVLELGDKILNGNIKDRAKKLLKEHDEQFVENIGKRNQKIF